MYGHQQTGEPGSAFWGPHGTIPADPSGTIGYRTIHFFSTNQIIVPNNSTAVAVRYGYYYFLGDGTNYDGGFDASTLGYPTSFTSVLTDWRVPVDHHERLQQHRPRRPQHHAVRGAHRQRHRCPSSWASTRSSSASTTGGCQGYAEAPNNAQLRVHAGVHAGAEPQHGEQRRRRRVCQLPARLSRQRRRQRRDAGDLLHRLLLGVRAGRLPDHLEAVAELRHALRVRAGHFRQGQPLHGRLRSRRAVPDAGAGNGAPGRPDVCRRGRLSDASGSNR